METTELGNKFREAIIENLTSEISTLEEKLRLAKARRNALIVSGLELTGKYFRVTNLGSAYVIYIEAKNTDIRQNNVIIVSGPGFIVADTDTITSVERSSNLSLEYETSPNVESYIFEEITKEEYEQEVREVINKL